MIACVRLALQLKGGPDSLVNVLGQSLSLAYPPFMRSNFITALTIGRGDSKLPHPSSIRRAELTVDLAFILCTRKLLQPNLSLWMLSDSSPIGGYDWLWSQCTMVANHLLVEAFDKFVELVEKISDFVHRRDAALSADQDSSQELVETFPTGYDPLPEWRPLLMFLKATVWQLVSTPIALGPGHRGLVDKVTGELHKWHLNLPQDQTFSEHADCYNLHTSDRGTEASLPRFRINGNHESLLPDWLDRELLQPDMQQEATSSDDLPEHEDVHVEEPRRGSLHAAAGSTDFLPRAMEFSGLQHIFDNVNSATHTSLAFWDTFHGMLKALEGLLRIEERRQRFVVSCLTGKYARYRGKFEVFNASLYEKRWREVVSFCKSLGPLLIPLAIAWDEGKYLRGVDTTGQGRETQHRVQCDAEETSGIWSFEPKKVTSALKHPLRFLLQSCRAYN